MDEIVLIKNHADRARLADYFRHIADGIDQGEVYEVRVAIDEGTFKVKANSGVWSPPIGARES